MAEVDLLFGVYFGYAIVIVLVFIIIAALVSGRAEEAKRQRKYDLEFTNGKYVLVKKKRPKP